MPDLDDLAATLAGIRERAETAADFPLAEIAEWTETDTKSIGGWIAASAIDVPLLLAAIEAVLKAADEAAEVRDYSGYETNGRLVGWNLSPAKLRETITRELAGEETRNG